jgi:predicted transcriptional regulator
MAPKPTFKEWVQAFGINAVANLCGVTERTVYHWISGHSKPSHANCLVILGRAKRLTYADIVGGAE